MMFRRFEITEKHTITGERVFHVKDALSVPRQHRIFIRLYLRFESEVEARFHVKDLGPSRSLRADERVLKLIFSQLFERECEVERLRFDTFKVIKK